MNYLHSELSGEIIHCAIEVHNALWPGLLESVYEECLYYELVQTGFFVKKQQSLPVVYKDVNLENGFKIDLLVEDKIIIEIKAIKALDELHMAQIMTYLKLTNCRLGLLINFNVKRLKSGIKRVII